MEKILEHLQDISQGTSTDLNIENYTELHKLATSFATESRKNYMSDVGGIDNDSDPSFFKLPNIEKRSENYTRKVYERQEAFKEIQQELINNIPLFQLSSIESNFKTVEDRNSVTRKALASRPNALILGVKAPNSHSCLMLTCYLQSERDKHLDTVFRSYNENIKQTRTIHTKIKEIARLVRNVHVMHPFTDGNGRTNIYGLMNKCLIEQGFCPAILPDGPEVFGGLKTLNSLVHDIMTGMETFIKEAQYDNPSHGWPYPESSEDTLPSPHEVVDTISQERQIELIKLPSTSRAAHESLGASNTSMLDRVNPLGDHSRYHQPYREGVDTNPHSEGHFVLEPASWDETYQGGDSLGSPPRPDASSSDKTHETSHEIESIKDITISKEDFAKIQNIIITKEAIALAGLIAKSKQKNINYRKEALRLIRKAREQKETAEGYASYLEVLGLAKEDPSIRRMVENIYTKHLKQKGITSIIIADANDSDIARKWIDFLNTLTNEIIYGLRKEVATKTTASRYSGGNSTKYKNITSLCDKIRIARRFGGKQFRTEYINKHGEITKEQAIDAALQLKAALDDPSLTKNKNIKAFHAEINGCYRQAGLS